MIDQDNICDVFIIMANELSCLSVILCTYV